MSLTRKNLDKMGCGVKNCGHDHSVLYFHGVCHPSAHPEVMYQKATGEIVVKCTKCHEEIARVQVAE